MRFQGAVLFVAWVGFGLAAVHAEVPTLPFAIGIGKPQWKIVPVERVLPSGAIVAGVVVGTGSASRAIIVTAPDSGGGADEADAFATHIREYVSRAPISHLSDTAETRIGYTGRVQRYEIVTSDVVVSCELFLFTTGENRWGVLQWAESKSVTAGADSPIGVLEKRTAAPAGVVSLPAFTIKDHAIGSFPIDLKVTENPISGKIAKIVVAAVPPGSALEREDISVGDEILEIDGRKTQDFNGGANKRSEFGKVFLNREPDSEVVLEIAATKPARRVGIRLTNSSKPATIRRP